MIRECFLRQHSRYSRYVVGNLKEKIDETTNFQQFEKVHEEQLPGPKHKLHNWTHFAGLYAAD